MEVVWSNTAANTEDIQFCPKGYAGKLYFTNSVNWLLIEKCFFNINLKFFLYIFN